MIRLVYVLRRKVGMSQSEFVDYALNTYGAMVKTNADALGIRKHQQLHNVLDPTEATVDPLRGKMLRPYDAVAEFWFDSLAEVEKFASADVDQSLRETERDFIEHSESSAWLAYEVPQINPTPETIVASPDSSLTRLFYCLRQPKDMSVEQAQWYWRVQHGPLVRSVGPAIQALRYMQVHALEHEFNQLFRKGRGLAAPFYGHAELWFDGSDTPRPDAKQAAVALYKDETRFIDFSESATFFGKDTVLFSADD